MNLYNYHSDKKTLHRHDEALEKVPKLIWQHFQHSAKQLAAREDVLALHPKYAYKYARVILKAPFVKGEDAIAKDPEYAALYARHVLNGPFEKGEQTILKSNNVFAILDYAVAINRPIPDKEYLLISTAKDNFDVWSSKHMVANEYVMKFPERKKNIKISDFEN